MAMLVGYNMLYGQNFMIQWCTQASLLSSCDIMCHLVEEAEGISASQLVDLKVTLSKC